MAKPVPVPKVNIETLRSAISTEYREVALNPQKGFQRFKITWRADVFSGAPQESSTADFGTKRINFRAVVPDVA